VQIGVSAETQNWLKKRWAYLRRTPAAVRFLSLEPLLDAIDTQEEFWEDLGGFIWPDWTIIGCESGSGHRVIPIESIIKTIHCFRQISRVFVKQDSGPRPGMKGRIPDAYWIKEFPSVVSL
jgi:protein gp37